MKQELTDAKDPVEAQLETVLPGVHSWHSATNQSVNSVKRQVDGLAQAFTSSITDLRSDWWMLSVPPSGEQRKPSLMLAVA